MDKCTVSTTKESLNYDPTTSMLMLAFPPLSSMDSMPPTARTHTKDDT